MCPIYRENQKAFESSEDKAIIKGFFDARAGKTKADNPYESDFEQESWNHGWRCWNSEKPVIPWALIKKLDETNIQKAKIDFSKTKILPDELEPKTLH